MKAIVKKALDDTEAVRFRLLLEHYTKLHLGLKSSLERNDVIPIENRISHTSQIRLTNTLRATSYGVIAVQMTIASQFTEVEKLIGGCRLLRALTLLKPLLTQDATSNLEMRRWRILRDAGFDIPAWVESGPNIDNLKVPHYSIKPVVLEVVNGKLKLELKPLQKEIRDQYQTFLFQYVTAIGALKGFEKCIREARISTDALMRQVKKYQTSIYEEVPTKLKEYSDLFTKKGSPWIGIGPTPEDLREIEEETLVVVDGQLKDLLGGKT